MRSRRAYIGDAASFSGGSDVLGLIDTNVASFTSIGSVTASALCRVTLFAWAAGGLGWNDADNQHPGTAGGGGTGAGKKVLVLSAGQSISWALANGYGQATTVTLPGGITLTVPAGGDASSYVAPGLGSTPSGTWDLIKIGGNGGANSNGVAGQDGAAGGNLTAVTAVGVGVNVSGGGGAAGFSDGPLASAAALMGVPGEVGTGGAAAIGGKGGSGRSGGLGRIVLVVSKA